MRNILKITFVILLTTCSLLNAQTLRDIEGNVYGMITIGTQTWMTENLKTTKFNDGTQIPIVTDNTEWSNLTTAAYCWYNNKDTAYSKVFGALYNWHSVNTGKLCPSGWHVPTDFEWNTFLNYLGGAESAAGKLIAVESGHWFCANIGMTNATDFSALPGGYRFADGNFGMINYQGNWWTSTASSTGNAWYRSMFCEDFGVLRNEYNIKEGYSIRCVKD